MKEREQVVSTKFLFFIKDQNVIDSKFPSIKLFPSVTQGATREFPPNPMLAYGIPQLLLLVVLVCGHLGKRGPLTASADLKSLPACSFLSNQFLH